MFTSEIAKAMVGTRIMVKKPLNISDTILAILGSIFFFIYLTIVA